MFVGNVKLTQQYITHKKFRVYISRRFEGMSKNAVADLLPEPRWQHTRTAEPNRHLGWRIADTEGRSGLSSQEQASRLVYS